MLDLDNFDPEGVVPLTECCVCLSEDAVKRVYIETEHFPFCGQHDHRFTFLKRGQEYRWPALRIAGMYAVSGDAQAYVLTALQGTDERVLELLDALEEYAQAQPHNAA